MFTTTKGNTNGCCSVKPKGKEQCPQCKEEAKGTLSKTLEHLLTSKAKENLHSLSGFYYCKTPSCKVVYFRETTILEQKDLNVIVGLKDGASPATICYCFGWTKEKIKEQLIQDNTTNALEDIKNKMNTIGCSCETLNPSGGCCLADNAKVIKGFKEEL